MLGLGRNGLQKLSRMEEGDRLWVYVNRKTVAHQVPRVREHRAVARVAGPVQRLSEVPWPTSQRGDRQETFSAARPIKVERDLAVPAEEVLRQLSFAASRNKNRWGWALIGAPLRLTDEDVLKLKEAVGSGRGL